MRAIQNNLHAQDPEIIEATVKNLGARNLYTALSKTFYCQKPILTSINFEDTYRTVIFRKQVVCVCVWGGGGGGGVGWGGGGGGGGGGVDWIELADDRDRWW